jgi:RES domain-containing protein
LAGVVVWRIARRPHALDRLGTGARQDGGRWNQPGTPVIYAGCTVAITALERFVHLAGVVPPDLVLVRVELPRDHSAEKPRLSDLPKDWDLVPAGPGSMEFGTQWAQEKRSLVLYVPSAVLREECNAILNPSHGEFVAVKMTIERDFHYDARMYLPRRAPIRKTPSPIVSAARRFSGRAWARQPEYLMIQRAAVRS